MYFDCAFGNQDGQVTFREFQNGLYYGNWVDTWDCGSEMADGFSEMFSTSSNTTDRGSYLGALSDQATEMWPSFSSGADVPSVNYDDWMGNSMESMHMDQYEADNIFVASDRDRNGVVSKKEFMKRANKMGKAIFNNYEDTGLIIGGALDHNMWYLSQGCYSPESYWVSLTQRINFDPWSYDDQVIFDQSMWWNALCQNWDLC